MDVWVVTISENDACHCHPEWRSRVEKVCTSEAAANQLVDELGKRPCTRAEADGPHWIEINEEN